MVNQRSSFTSFTSKDIEDIRAATPGVQRVVHFNNAGAALMPLPVAEKIREYLDHELWYGGYETASAFADQLWQVYLNLAQFLQCQPEEIAILENATVAWGQAFLSIPFQRGDIILTSMAEYASNYIAFLQVRKRTGVEIRVIPNNEFGEADVEALADMISPKVRLIAITHVPTNGGLVNPAEEIGKIASQHNVLYLLDACQSAGQMPLNIDQIGCDFLSATSRKFLRGPRGVGFLYVKKERIGQLEPPLLDLHSATWTTADSFQIRDDARRFENWEHNPGGILGLSEAVKYAMDLGIERIWDRIQKLATLLRVELAKIPGVTVHDLGRIKSGIVSFSGPFEAAEMKAKLSEAGFNTSLIVAEGTLLDMNNRGLDEMIRASVHYYNLESEIERFVEFINGQVINASVRS